MVNMWDIAELDAELAAADRVRVRQIDSECVTSGRPPKLLRLPGEPGTPEYRRRTAVRWPDGAASLGVEIPSTPSGAWVAEVRRLLRARLITRDEARAFLGLPPLPRWHKVWRTVRRYRVVWR